MREFAGNNRVAFGDVNMGDFGGSVPAKFGAGVGGWPTVRYFNTETGYDGAPYIKKTSKGMCDELGDVEYMRAYVNDVAGPKCSAADRSTCSEKEAAFLITWADKSAVEVSSEYERLGKLVVASSGKPAQLSWIRQRHTLLRSLLVPAGPASTDAVVQEL